MKFESKFGIGEIVLINYTESYASNMRKNNLEELVGKIIQVSFSIDGTCSYIVEIICKDRTIQRVPYPENMLYGDPDFDQELGRYKDEP